MTFQAKLRLDFNIKVFWNVILSNVSHGIIFIWQKLKEIGSMEPQFWLVDFLWSTTMNHLSSLTFSWLFGLMEDDICVGWCNVLGPWNDVFWSKNECASCWIQVGRPCNCVWKMEVENIQNGPSTCTHALVLCYFGQMRWSWTFWNGEVKGNNFHVEHFFIWSLYHDEFSVGSLGNQTYLKIF